MSKAKLRLVHPFQCWCVDGRGFHKHFSIISLFKAIKEKNRYNNQRTKCFCPKCDNELCGSDSYLFFRQTEKGGFEVYQCSLCKHKSFWDFDCVIPLLVENIH